MPHAFGAVYREVFLPPVNRAMRLFDPNFFRKTIPLAGADIGLVVRQAKVKRQLVRDVLDAPRIDPWVTTKIYGKHQKLLLLKPGIVFNDPKTFSPKMSDFLENKWMSLHPYNLELAYDYWTFDEILGAVLPEELGTPERGYERLGHVGNMIIEKKFLPYKDIIARVLLDKTPQIKTVVMKHHGGEVSGDPSTIPPMEFIAGEENTNVTMAASKMTFKFDFKKCYWDSQMEFPNLTLSREFNKAETVIDVAAGVGHLSVPVAKKKIWVFANDPNKDNYEAMKENISFNKAKDFCHPFNLSPREFIPFIINKIAAMSEDEAVNKVLIPCPHFVQPHKGPPPPAKNKLSPLPHHFVINSRAGAISLLSAFRGAYDNVNLTDTQLPWIHLYIRQQYRQPEHALGDVAHLIYEELKYPIRKTDIKLELVLKTKPICVMRATFRLPRAVAVSEKEKKRRLKAGALERKTKKKRSKGPGQLKECSP